ncbi:AAEL008538-PA [Aedes aegypti]|uniref:AAEL008538-PA n=1 Tax=Aedes aegypti TaxID=7159 RepID=Q16YH3_AEDAE|nr:AAEL008538-PA [Aedes aegypti]
MDSDNCLTCDQASEKFYSISNADIESKPNISHIMRQHFWFQEDELRSAIICESCWQNVDQFHRFYEDVRKLHKQRMESKPLAVFFKQEEETVAEEQLFLDSFLDADEIVECKIEDKTNSNATKTKKLRKASKRSSTDEPKAVPKRIKIPLEQEQAEDDFIKRHTSYVCETCSEQFDDFNTIRKHTTKAHDKPYIMCCNKKFRTRSILYQHVQTVFNPDSFKCEICGKTFKGQSIYDRHKENSHSDEHLLVFKCHRCPKAFTKQKILDHHIAGHETFDNEEAKCDECGKCFRTQVTLKIHIDTVHRKTINFVCEYCSKGFNRQADLMDHRKTHELTADQMKKQCPICNKLVKNSRYFQRHIDRHQTEGSHKCDHCSHVSNNLLALKEHVEKRHSSKAKMYPCNQCGQEFKRLVRLKEHISTAHTGEPLYQCPFCERTFFSNVTMYVHKKKDHPQEWLEDRNAKYAKTEQDG